MSDLRTTPALNPPEIIRVKPPHSNFSFLENRFGDSNLESIQRIFSQARILGFKTLVIENIESVGFSKEDDLELQAEGLDISTDPLVRISFLKEEATTIQDIEALTNEHFLGYVILKKIQFAQGRYKWIVFESVMAVTRHENNYMHKLRKYNINVGGKFFTVVGILYCQQNTLTNVCAHAALRTCISIISPPADVSYSRMNKIIAEGGKPHKIGEGLSLEQICLILEKFGIKYSLQTYQPNPLEKGKSREGQSRIPYQSFLYSSVESGYPALLGFSIEEHDAHIIPVFGHTFNEDTWVPRAKTSYFEVGKDTRYVPSEAWVSTYICHDDNFGSYYCLPRNYLSGDKTITVIALRPCEAEFDAIVAEAIAADYLYTLTHVIEKEGAKNVWAKRLAKALTEKRGWFVLRTLCMNKTEYIEHLRLLKGWDDKTIPQKLVTALSEGLPDLLWVAEVSLPELFPANRRKLGEIVLDPSKPVSHEFDLANFILARILDKVYCLQSTEEGIGLIAYDSEIDTHTSLSSIQVFSCAVPKTCPPYTVTPALERARP